jgi:arylsulfatase
MVVRWPNHVPVGQVSHAPWYFADILPTLRALTGASLPSGVDGINVLPTLLGEKQAELDTRVMYWEQYSKIFQQAVRKGKWKGHFTPSQDRFELYDLSTDQLEQRDVSAQYPEVVDELMAFMKSAHTPSPNWVVR